MRTAILANTLPAALPIYEEVKRYGKGELFVILCPPGRGGAKEILKHAGRLLLKAGRRQSINLWWRKQLTILPQPLDHPRSLMRLSRMGLDVGLHKSGNIYRADTIKCFRLGILNAHIGLLPAYRGRSVAEWSVFEGQPCGISVFFVDAGIDTGERIVLKEEVDVSHCESLAAAKQYLFNLDAVFYRRSLELLDSGQDTFLPNDATGRRYFVMSNCFRRIAEQIFSTNQGSHN